MRRGPPSSRDSGSYENTRTRETGGERQGNPGSDAGKHKHKTCRPPPHRNDDQRWVDRKGSTRAEALKSQL